MLPLVFIAETVLIGLCFFLIPGFVSVNAQLMLPGGNIPWNIFCTATDLPSQKTMQDELQEKQEWTRKWRSYRDPNAWTSQFWPTSKNLPQLCADKGSSLEDFPGEIDDREWTRGNQSNLMIMLESYSRNFFIHSRERFFFIKARIHTSLFLYYFHKKTFKNQNRITLINIGVKVALT